MNVSRLLEGDETTARFRDAGMAVAECEPSYVRHKPGETTIVAFRLTASAEDSTTNRGENHTWGYAHWSADARRAATIYNKAMSFRPRPSLVGPGLVRLDAHTVVYVFPNDARLRKLRWYSEPRKLKRSLAELTSPGERISARKTSVEVLRYKPERRVVAKVTMATKRRTSKLLLRYSTQTRAKELGAVANHLRSYGVDTPQPIAQLANGHVSIDEFVSGTQLRDIVSRDQLVDGSALADALGRFHSVPPTSTIGKRSAESELARSNGGLCGLRQWEPALASRARNTAAALRRTAPQSRSSDVLLHGDLHAKNILIDGEQMVFVDLERVAMGPVAIDLGYFHAHAIAHAIRTPGESPTAETYAVSTIDSYRTRFAPIADDELGWHTAIGLVDQALLVARHLEPGWRATSAALLDAAVAHLRPRTLSAVR